MLTIERITEVKSSKLLKHFTEKKHFLKTKTEEFVNDIDIQMKENLFSLFNHHQHEEFKVLSTPHLNPWLVRHSSRPA
jgi:hypothetical protein